MSSGEEPLVQAIKDDDAEALRRHLDSLDSREELVCSSLLTSLLHVAVEWNRIEIVDLLLKRGADIEGRDKEGLTPLMHAVTYCVVSPPMVQLLIEAGADADAEVDGVTVVDCLNSADTGEVARSAALELIWKAPRQNRMKFAIKRKGI